MTDKIADLMKKLEITYEEAKALLEDDSKIDHGEDLFPLTPEQKETEKKMRITGQKTVYNFPTRERKPNQEKRELIAAIEEMLTYSDIQAENAVITNPERQIDFVYKNTRYRIILSAPRK